MSADNDAGDDTIALHAADIAGRALSVQHFHKGGNRAQIAALRHHLGRDTVSVKHSVINHHRRRGKETVQMTRIVGRKGTGTHPKHQIASGDIAAHILPAQTARRSAIATLFLPPTFTPRSKATYD